MSDSIFAFFDEAPEGVVGILSRAADEVLEAGLPKEDLAPLLIECAVAYARLVGGDLAAIRVGWEAAAKAERLSARTSAWRSPSSLEIEMSKVVEQARARGVTPAKIAGSQRILADNLRVPNPGLH